MKIIALVVCLCLLAISLPAKKLAVLEEIVNPDSMVIDGSDMYITQEAEVFIYDFKTLEFKNKFGKKGQGPQEIPPFPIPMSRIPLMRIVPLPDKLFVSSIGKILYFTKQGEFIKEFKYPFQRISNYNAIFPLGSDIVCQLAVSKEKEIFNTVSFVDKDYQQKKELTRKKIDLHGGKMNLFSGSLIFEVYKDRIFVAGDDFSIDIFDKNGKLQKQIKHPHEPIKFDDEMRKKFDETLKFMFKSFYDQFKIMLYYPDYLPIIFNLQLSDPYLYVLTWDLEGKSRENRGLFIFNLDGTFVKKTIIPFKMAQFIIPYPFDIMDKNLYQVVENEDTEEWELHQNSIH